MRRVALTGGIATGKTSVRRAFEALGVPTIDSDALARDAVAPGTTGLNRIVEAFGPGVLDRAGALDRKALASIVFADATARRTLEQIVHPFVRQATERWFASLDPSRHSSAIADIPLLFETGRDADFDTVIVVACAPETQRQRLIARDGITEAEAQTRIDAQLPMQTKIGRADFVIRTDGAMADTEQEVSRVKEALDR